MKTNKKGATVIEVILATIILSIFIAGGAWINTYASLWIAMYQNKSIALQYANSRLERLQASLPTVTKDLYYSTYYVRQDGTVQTGNPNETVPINGQQMSVATTVKWIDANPLDDPTVKTWDYLLTDVQVQYKTNPNKYVELQTYIGKHS